MVGHVGKGGRTEILTEKFVFAVFELLNKFLILSPAHDVFRVHIIARICRYLKLITVRKRDDPKVASTSGEKSSKQNFLAVNLSSRMTSLDESNFRKSSASERLFFIPFQVFIATR